MRQYQFDDRPYAAPIGALRALAIGVGLSWLLFVVMRFIGPLGSLALLFFLLMVALHVAGNALGTSLGERLGGYGPAIDDDDGPPPGSPPRIARLRRMHPGRLVEHSPVTWSTVALTALGALCGGTLGALGFYFLMRATLAGLIVGAVSSAVLGGFFGFLASSFMFTFWVAWRQSLQESQRRF